MSSLRMRGIMLATLSIALALVRVCAQGKAGGAYLDGSIHEERRALCADATNWDVVAGYDFLLWRALGIYVGPRVGLYAETNCTAARSWGIHYNPSLGVQARIYWPAALIGGLGLDFGGAADICFNFDATLPGETVRVDPFVEAFIGARYDFGRAFIGFRLDAGRFLFFDDPPVFAKAGAIIGFDM